MEKKLSDISEKVFNGIELTSEEATIVCNALKSDSSVIDDTPLYKHDDKDLLINIGFKDSKEGKYAIIDMEELLKKEIKGKDAEAAIEHIEKVMLSDWKLRRVLIGYCLGAYINNDPLRGFLNRFLK